MKHLKFSIIAIGLAITACTKDLEDLSAPDNTNIVTETTINKYHISPDSALLFLNEFLNENNNVTRANKSKSVGSIIPLSALRE